MITRKLAFVLLLGAVFGMLFAISSPSLAEPAPLDETPSAFSGTLQANLQAGDTVVAEAGSQVYGQVVSSGEIGRGIVAQHSDLVLTLTDINVEGTMYPIQTGSFSENSTSVILRRRSVVVPAGSLLEFRLKQPLTVKK